ncbi:MAG: RNA polymerase sporulation sigma factor SigK [Clostridiales bacterium]|jgi:RNA polymerase sporulation-specific sigma factor|nr:RNA polymerase sporulation sigma factor SigK [Clostridiales bacterium]
MFLQVKGGGSFPKTLTKEEEARYLDLLVNGSREDKTQAKDELISRNLRLVAHIVKKYNSKECEDLISVGTVGLIKGICTFNADRGTKLATYASRCIENEILMYLRAQKKLSREVFLNDPIGVDKEGKVVTIEDKLKDENYSIDEKVGLKMQVHLLRGLIEVCLTSRERAIILYRYGLLSGKEITQRETAKLLGISRSYVSRIEKKALKKLKREMKADG